MKTADKLIIIETKLKYLEKLIYGLAILIVGAQGIEQLRIGLI